MKELFQSLKARYLDNVRSQSFDDNWDRVNEENRSGIVLILFFTFAVILVNVVVQLSLGLNVTTQFAQLGIYAALSLVVYQRVLKRDTANYTLWIYLIEIPLIAISMVSGTILETHGTTFTFMFILLAFPPLILDKPKRVSAFILAAAAAYTVLDYPCKSPQDFSRDMLHLFNVCLISIVVTGYYASTRMENIRYAGFFAAKAVRDPLTGLFNRAGAEQNIDATSPGALVYLDLDNFKSINDTLGHAEGDKVLVKTARVLRRGFRDEDAIVRLGGDEFVVFAKGNWNEDVIGSRLRHVLDNLGEIEIPAHGKSTIKVLASVGCVISRDGCESLADMIRLADEQMYQVKQGGKSGYRIIEVP